MNKKITSDNKIIILAVATSYGEIDWILPVLNYFLKKHQNWRLVTIFGHKVVFDRFKLTSQKLYKEFEALSCLNIVPQEIDSLFSKTIHPDQVKLIFKDFNNDEFAPFKTLLAEKCPKAMLISHPHSSHIYSNKETDTITFCDKPDDYSKHDLFLLASENDIPYWSEFVDIRKIRAVGNPRFDAWWIDRFVNDPEFISSIEYQRAQNSEKVFFYVGRGVHPHYLSQDDYEYLISSMADVIFSYDDSFLLLKPHPRQDIDELFRLLAPYDKKRYLVSGLHLLQLSYLSDVVISPWTSPLDGLAVGKPVIEFWRFGGKDPICRKDSNGNDTTIYRELGLVAPADTKEEFKILIQQALDNPKAPFWTSRIEIFKRICKTSDQVSMEIVNLLETELERRSEEQLEEVEPIIENMPDELILDMIAFISSLVETNQEKRAQEWLEFMYSQFPKDARVLNNLGIFLFNNGKVTDAVDRLVECLNIDPLHLDAAVNLIQILLILDRTNDALEIVISYYAQTADENLRTTFLQTLAQQLTEQQFSIVRQRIEQMRL